MTDSKAEGALALSFNSITFEVVERDGKSWLQAADIARALGYAREDAVSRIYERNADEFSFDMSETVKLTVSGNLKKEARIFSLRGAHLLAMFARTKVAKAFRKWVLDVLDREVERLTQEQAPAPYMSLTDCGEKAKVGKFLVAMRKRAVQHLEQIEKQMAVWEIVDKEDGKTMPSQQAMEISTRLERLGKLFHPFSDQFVDVLGLSRALRGLDPKVSVSRAGWVEVLPKITA